MVSDFFCPTKFLSGELVGKQKRCTTKAGRHFSHRRNTVTNKETTPTPKAFKAAFIRDDGASKIRAIAASWLVPPERKQLFVENPHSSAEALSANFVE